MKVLLLSDPSNPHTIKWANSLSRMGIKVYVYGFFRYDKNEYDSDIKADNLRVPFYVRKQVYGSPVKLFYLSAYFPVKKIIKVFKPDIVHAHYATSYGLMGALTNFHPFFLNVWGKSDIFDFPQKSGIHQKIYKFILNRSDRIISTSTLMTNELKKYTEKDIVQIPFGVDINEFNPVLDNDRETLNIGIIKSLESLYGVQRLIKAFAIVKEKLSDRKMKLIIVGGGTLRKKLEILAAELNIFSDTEFTGRIPYKSVYRYHQMLDIEVFPSVFETFGVAVLEASSCGNPVIVSDSGGLPEVVQNNQTGFIVPSGDIQALADAIIKLAENKDLRRRLGENGRKMVADNFSWQDSVYRMIDLYKGAV